MDFGIDRLARSDALGRKLRGARVGLLAHAASVDRGFRHASEVLRSLGVEPVVLFAPEHGFGGAAQDMVGIGHEQDRRRALPIVSLYGERFEELSPPREWLERLDLLLVDLVDVGSRYYTFVWTALLAVRAAAAAGVHSIVLDRPNPLGGRLEDTEGKLQKRGFCSFVGLEPVPVRHGLTIGELVALHAAADGLALGRGGALSVVPLVGWDRNATALGWDRPFVQPSPNMPTFDTALVYPGGCLVEGTNLSEGRGLTRPFELIGAPWLDGERLARDLDALGLPGFTPRAVTFVPTFHKHAGQRCEGVQIHPTDVGRFRPMACYLALVTLAHAQAPERFRFRTERYEFVDDVPAFDLLTGSDVARRAILDGAEPRAVAHELATPDPGWDERTAAAREAVARAAIGE